MGVKPEGRFRDELREELEQKDREILKEREKKKNASKSSSNRIKALEERREEILDLLDGRESLQPALPLTTPKAGTDGKKPAPPPLVWKLEGDNATARVPGGTYCVEPDLVGTGVLLWWTPEGGKKSEKIGTASGKSAGQDIAKAHYLKAAADGILDNAGHGALTKGRGRKKKGEAEGRP